VTGRDRIVLLVLLGAALLAGFWFTQIAPKRETLKTLDADIATQRKRLDQARATETQATAAKRRYDSDYATVARLGKAVPVDDNVPSLVYQLESAAKGAKVDFRSLKLNASGGGAPAPTPAPAPAASGSSAGASSGSSSGSSGSASGSSSGSSGSASGSSPGSSGTATAAGGTPAATQAAAATLPPGASVGPAGFPTMPFTFVFDGSFFSMEKFLRNVDGFTRVRGEQLSVSGRLLSIDGFSLTASRSGFPRVKATLAATAYLLPADEGLTAGATPAGPTPAAGTPATGTGATASTPATTTTGTG
jgi:hypothetical protein